MTSNKEELHSSLHSLFTESTFAFSIVPDYESQPYSSSRMHIQACGLSCGRTLTYRPLTGLNLFSTGVKWSQFPVNTCGKKEAQNIGQNNSVS